MRSVICVLAVLFVLCVASSAEATNFRFRSRSSFHGQQFRGNDFNDGFRQGFNAAQRQRFDNGFHNRGIQIRAPFFRFGF